MLHAISTVCLLHPKTLESTTLTPKCIAEAYAELAEERLNNQRKIDEIQNAYNKDKQDWADLQLKQSEIIQNNKKSLEQELAKERSITQRKIEEIQNAFNADNPGLYKKQAELVEENKKLERELARERSISQRKIGQILEAYNKDSRFWKKAQRKQAELIEMNDTLLERERTISDLQRQVIKKQGEAIDEADKVTGKFGKALETPAESQDTKNILEAEKKAHAETTKQLEDLRGKYNDLLEQEQSRDPWSLPTAWRPRKYTAMEDDAVSEKPPLTRKGPKHKEPATKKREIT